MSFGRRCIGPKDKDHGDSLTAKKPSPEDKSHGENI